MRFIVSAVIGDETIHKEYATQGEAVDAFENAIKAEAFRVVLFDGTIVTRQYDAE